MLRTIIIDDEELAREGLKLQLKKLDSIAIVGEAKDGEDGAELIKNIKPDLAFLDINMPDMDGFQMLQKIEHKPLIIFTTAYNEFALKAFKENAIDYLLKPIQFNDLHRSILKAQQYVKGQNFNLEHIASLLNQTQKPNYKTRILFEKASGYVPVNTSEIGIFYSKDKQVSATMLNGQRLYLNDSLENLESQLNPEFFYRINRQAIVNITAIKDVSTWFKGKLKINLNFKFDEELMISSEKATQFKQWLKS